MVLYRKYRPKTFGEVVGQEHVIQTLTNAISNGLLSHAYLFAGPRGSGKTTIARLLAKAVNCENLQRSDLCEPCNKCGSCAEINEGRSMDLIEIDAASHRGIDEIRELKEGIKFAPTRLKYKVFIIDECHQLSKEAANALLKTLEEPPSHAIFILATTEIHKMISTIISRCQRFDFRKLTLSEIVRRLETISKLEKAKIDKAALELIALNSGGSVRDGESILDQVLTFAASQNKAGIETKDIETLLGLVEIKMVSDFTDLLLQKKIGEAFKFLSDITDKGSDLQEFAKSLVNYLRQALVVKIVGTEAAKNLNSIISGLTAEEMEKLGKQAGDFSEDDLKRAVNLFLDAENKIKYSSIPQLPLELAIVETIEAINK